MKNEVSGVHISYQLLEISRLCGKTTYGSNFHIFYIIALHAPNDLKDKLGLKDRLFKV